MAKHNSNATTMPNHMSDAAIGAPYRLCMAKVSQRKAPGAMSAMALEVRPVRPNVALVVGVSRSAMG